MADRFFVNGGVDNSWSSTSNWSATSGGAGGSSIPTAGDAVFFDTNSPNCTVNASNRVALSLNFTGYSNTITMTFAITVSGNVTLSANMGISGTGALTINGSSTLTSNGRSWPNTFNLQVSVTYTLADNWTVSGLVNLGASGTSNVIINGNTLTCSGGITTPFTSGTLSGTTTLRITGGIFTANSHTAGSIRNPIDFDGNFTFASGCLLRVGGSNATIRYLSGTITFAGTHQIAIAGNCTFDTSTLEFKDILFASAFTLTLSSNLVCSGNLLTAGGSVTQTINGQALCIGGNLSYNQSSNPVLTGSGEIRMIGTGTISQLAGTGTPNVILAIDTTGDIVISSLARWDLGKFVFRKAKSVTTTEAWVTSGGGSYSPIDNILIG
jgi:hypothetical protein